MQSHTSIKKYDTLDAADYLGIKPSTLETWRSLGKGPRYTKLGRRVVYEVRDLDAFAASRVVETIDTVGSRLGGGHV